MPHQSLPAIGSARRLGSALGALVSLGTLSAALAGCQPVQIDPRRIANDGIPVLGAGPCCPEERLRGTPRLIGNVDLRQYGPQPLCGDELADKLAPWRAGPDCDGRETLAERLIGRRRLGHTLPLLGWLGVGRHSPPGTYASPRTPELDQEIVRNAIALFSVQDSCVIDGIRVRDDDVLATDGRHVAKLIDGGDIGAGKLEIDALAMLDDSTFLISYARDFVVDADHPLPGLEGPVHDEDVLCFQATCLGEQTRGTFRMYLDGSDVGLGDDGVDVDALAVLDDGSLLLSFSGRPKLNDKTIAEGDLMRFTPQQLGEHSQGTWELYLDSDDVALRGQNIDALAIDLQGRLLLSTEESWANNNLVYLPADVFPFRVEQTGSKSAGDVVDELVIDARQPLDLAGATLDGNNLSALCVPSTVPVTTGELSEQAR